MSDNQWETIVDDVRDAAKHYLRATQIYDEGKFDGDNLHDYKQRMSFMLAMSAAHTSFESAIKRIFSMFDEDTPRGDSWHDDLIRWAAREKPGSRPAILDPHLTFHLQQSRRFRHVAMRTYNDFNWDLAAPAVDSARILTTALPKAIVVFHDALGSRESADNTKKTDSNQSGIPAP